MRGSQRAVVAAVVVVVVLVGAAGALLYRALWAVSPLEEAVRHLPAATLRVSFTDWARVTESVGGSRVDAGSSPEEMRAFLDEAFDQDLTVSSSLTSSFVALADAFGVTPVQSDWEVYGQGPSGSVAVLQLADDVDAAAIEDRIAELGWEAPPDGAGTEGVWVGNPELVAGLPEPLTPLQENLAVLPDDGLFVMADDPAFVQTAVDAIRGDGETLEDVEGLGSIVGEAQDPATATIWVSDFACTDLAMSQADPSDARVGRELVDEAGGVHTLDGLMLSQASDQTLRIVFGFADEEQASADLQPRTDLAAGPAPGQGGAFSERFRITSATASGRLVTLEAEAVGEKVLADLGQGPLLFATC